MAYLKSIKMYLNVIFSLNISFIAEWISKLFIQIYNIENKSIIRLKIVSSILTIKRSEYYVIYIYIQFKNIYIYFVNMIVYFVNYQLFLTSNFFLQ